MDRTTADARIRQQWTHPRRPWCAHRRPTALRVLRGNDMRRVLLLLILVLVAAGAGAVTWMNAVAGGGLGGCPTALLEGPLVRAGDTLVVGEPPASTHVRWPFSYGVERDGDSLVLRHLGSTVAREGDWVLVGGGMLDDETWTACGAVTRGTRPEASAPAAATNPAGSTSTPPVASTSTPTSTLGVPALDLDAAPAAIRLLPDDPDLHGTAVGRSPVVGLPDGSFLLLRSEDVENGGVLLHSPDGTAWAPLDGNVPGTAGTSVRGLAATPRAVVAWGAPTELCGGCDGDDPPLAIWRSDNGMRWDLGERTTIARFEGHDLIATERGFVLLGLDEILVGDPEGRTWARVPLALEIADVAATGDGWIAVGSADEGGVAWTSPDGRSWTRLPGVVAGGDLWSVAVVGSRVVVTGSRSVVTEDDETSTPLVLESPDGGRSWSMSPVPLEGMDNASVLGLPGGFLVQTSTDRFDGPRARWLAMGDGPWAPVDLEDPGLDEHVGPSSAAGTPDRTVFADSTAGTGGGGDRVITWVWEPAP
jgi:hypothetical protein